VEQRPRERLGDPRQERPVVAQPHRAPPIRVTQLTRSWWRSVPLFDISSSNAFKRPLLVVPISLSLVVGCGLFTGGTTDTGTGTTMEPAGPLGGIEVDCGDGTKVCVWESSTCPVHDYYLSRLDCAKYGPGTPFDYIGELTFGQSCDPFYPANGTHPAFIGSFEGPCSDCAMCYSRAQAWAFGNIPAGDLSELQWCPSLVPNEVEISELCTNPQGNSGVWTCPASLQTIGIYETWSDIEQAWTVDTTVYEAQGIPSASMLRICRMLGIIAYLTVNSSTHRGKVLRIRIQRT